MLNIPRRSHPSKQMTRNFQRSAYFHLFFSFLLGFASLKEEFIFRSEVVSHFDIDLFLSFFNELQFNHRHYIFNQTFSSFILGVVHCYVQGASGTYQLSLMRCSKLVDHSSFNLQQNSITHMLEQYRGFKSNL